MDGTDMTGLLMAGFFGGWETVLVVAIMLILLGDKELPNLLSGLGKGMGAFKKATREVNEELHRGGPCEPDESKPPQSQQEELIVWIARGFGMGCIPFAPGTFGTLLGFLWVAILLVPGSLTIFVIGTLGGLAASVWLCGAAERILGQRDPGSIVLDEIVAIPVCYLGWIAVECARHSALPPLETFFTGRGLWHSAILFLLFRVFDIAKPWPVRQSQSLPGGWGVTADDILAAVYVALASLLFVW